jgi:hypothetical protein
MASRYSRLFFMLLKDSIDRLFELVAVLVVGLAHDLLLSSVALALLDSVSTGSAWRLRRAGVEQVIFMLRW